MAHIRLLSWLLLGSVNHTIRFGVSESAVSQPIPLEASCHIADQVCCFSFVAAALWPSR